MTIGIRDWPGIAATVARTYGARGAWLRGVHELRRTTGRFKAAPVRLPSGDLSSPHPFTLDLSAIARETDRARALEIADRVVGGEYCAFSWDWRPLPQRPGEWLVHPRTGKAYDRLAAWWHVPHLDPVIGDVKEVWEPARFAWAYPLIRAFAITKDDRYAAAFHRYLAGWREDCPPFRGVHWSCGQETAIRATALLYAEAAFRDAPSSTPEAMRRLAAVLSASGERIADAIGYAVSQRNNHAISEAAGLIALGIRFAGAHPDARRWQLRGTARLEISVREQFAHDGWYIQHSFNYLRLALDQCVIAQRALRSVGRRLSDRATARLAAAIELLGAVIDPPTGIVPNHGPNDGALVHPVSLAGYRDFRPTLTAVCASFNLRLPAGLQADRETTAWLGLPRCASEGRFANGVKRGASGWATARSGEIFVFLRAGKYWSRPGHIDSLHVDIRIGSSELVVDPGTYSYNAPPLTRQLAAAEAHNGPRRDDRPSAMVGPRFLWLKWPEATILDVSWDGETARIVAAGHGVRRTVTVSPRVVTVSDESEGEPSSPLRIRWTLHPDADPAAVELPAGAQWTPRAGCFAPFYGLAFEAPIADITGPDDAGPVVTTFRALRGAGPPGSARPENSR